MTSRPRAIGLVEFLPCLCCNSEFIYGFMYQIHHTVQNVFVQNVSVGPKTLPWRVRRYMQSGNSPPFFFLQVIEHREWTNPADNGLAEIFLGDQCRPCHCVS